MSIKQNFWSQLIEIIARIRNVNIRHLRSERPAPSAAIPETLSALATVLTRIGRPNEAETIQKVRELVVDSPSFGGLGLTSNASAESKDYDETLFLVEAWLEALNSEERSPRSMHSTATTRASATRPMTLAQKIFAQHAIGGCSIKGLQAGNVVRVGVDWILASELSWAAMAKTHEEMGSPGIWRNDRFWLAGDHVVHPTTTANPKVKTMIDVSEKAKREFRMTEYQGMNYTIMHTEFVRERAEPGMLALGSDSHTCSAGAVGCLAVGLGVADVTMALSMGETWFKIPESVQIEFIGKPTTGISGKDVILYILKELKRNTVAAERIVEFVGEGLRHLSCDARFAISNMCTEFGAISGIFEPDDITHEYISHRRRKANKSNSIYFRADRDAEYASKHIIDLSKIEASIAVYPEPDHVVAVSEMAGTPLDGIFIGACTTTEEELVLAALVLKAGIDQGLRFNTKGKRHYVPGSLPIVEKLKQLGILEIYEKAGFTRGPPGCSYCLGLSAEKANEGETWLSSQNRNFKNRMGKGSFGHVTSAIVCAASAFDMVITDPAPLVARINTTFFNLYRGYMTCGSRKSISYSEPSLKAALTQIKSQDGPTSPSSASTVGIKTITSRITTLEDFIDTDALAPGSTLTTCITDEDFGQHVLEHTHPNFRQKVKNGQQVVVAGNAFGVGSSRENAVSALKGAGVKAVIARSFAFIYGRNQPSLGLLGITMSDEDFFARAKEDAEITIDVSKNIIIVGNGNNKKEFGFQLSDIEYNLITNKGIAEAYKKYGKEIWGQMTESSSGSTNTDVRSHGTTEMMSIEDAARLVEPDQITDRRLEW